MNCEADSYGYSYFHPRQVYQLPDFYPYPSPYFPRAHNQPIRLSSGAAPETLPGEIALLDNLSYYISLRLISTKMCHINFRAFNINMRK